MNMRIVALGLVGIFVAVGAGAAPAAQETPAVPTTVVEAYPRLASGVLAFAQAWGISNM